MSVFKSHGRLLLAAVPILVLVAALTGFLSAGSDGEPETRLSTARPDRQPNPTKTGLFDAYQVAQLRANSASGARTGEALEPDTPVAQPVLRVYRCARGSAEAVAARLEAEFRGNPGVRVVPDARTSQVLVMAPPEVQARIADRLPPAQPAGTPEQLSPPVRPSSAPSLPSPASPAAGSPQAPLSQEVRLWRATGGQFEAALVRMLADRLTSVASSQPDASAYRLLLGNGRVLRLSIDRRANRVQLVGSRAALGAATQLIHALDSPEESADRHTRLLALNSARMADVRPVIEALRTGYSRQVSPAGDATAAGLRQPLRLAMAFQQPGRSASGSSAAGPADTPAAAAESPTAPKPGPETQSPGEAPTEAMAEEGGLIGPVQIEPIEGTDFLVIRGHERDVQKVLELIEQIEQLAEIEKPVTEVYHLSHVDCRSLATLLTELYEEVFSARQGAVSITALVRPNAVLLIGGKESVDTVVDLIKRLDRPVPPSAQFQVFRLQNAAAETAQEAIAEFFAEEQDEEGGLGTRVQVTADFRTNSLIVRASPRDLKEVAAIIARIDAPENETINEVRIFKLKNSLAADLAPVLQDAITGQMYGQRTGQQAFIQRAPGMEETFERKSVRLQFVTTDEEGRRTLNSGILTDVQITADERANALIVTASAESMPLVAALIEQLDQLPTAEAQVKVFTIVHGDATNMRELLEELFGAQAQAAEPAVRTGATGEDSSLVSLRFATDVRTNSIIATGSSGDLVVVEAILMRLDESELRKRQTVVVRLRNASAQVVADAISQFLANELEAAQPVQGLLSSVEQTEREVVVVPEEITNSLIISATERYFDRITDLVDKLDARPPMVMIQVLIVAVDLDDTEEFGVEFGLQDSILFDRSVDGIPGFLFNSTSPLGNNTAAPGSAIVGTQGLTNLSLGRSNPSLGYGGFVFSASSEAVSVLIRALQENRRVDVLARPQIMTTNSVEAMIHVGESVPSVTSVAPGTQLGSQTFQVEYFDVGLQLLVVPRINPDGLVVMEITAIRSEVGPEEDGIPVSIAADGTVLRSPRIEIVETQTTVSAMDGQTVILGGLISTDKAEVHRQVPWLGDIPVLGHLFRFDSVTEERKELLFILTPHVIESDDDLELLKQIEAARMNWCYSDVLDVHGDIFDSQGQTPVIYPDLDPAAPTISTPEPATGAEKGVPTRAEDSPFIIEPVLTEPFQQETIPPEPSLPEEQGAAGWPALTTRGVG